MSDETTAFILNSGNFFPTPNIVLSSLALLIGHREPAGRGDLKTRLLRFARNDSSKQAC